MKRKIITIVFAIAFFLFFKGNVYASTSAPVSITDMNIIEIQEAIDSGYLTYETLFKIYLERIEAYDSSYSSLISVNPDALDLAIECDKNYLENGRDSLLYCIPIIVKDNIDVVSFPTTAGTLSLSDNYPNSDALLISKLKDKGAIVIAKANMSEFAFMANTSTSSYGTVKNAYNTSYESYGSSGGSATSVALNFAPVAIGTDTNLSVRGPSSANNLYGMRPTFGSISSDGVIGYDITRDTAGAITKNVIDNAILTAVMQGFDEDYYLTDEVDLSNFTIGVLDEFVNGLSGTSVSKASSTVTNLFEQSIKLLEDNGATIVHISSFYNSDFDYISSSTISGWTMCYSFNNYISNTSSSIRSFSDLNRSSGHIYSLNEYYEDCSNSINSITSYASLKDSYYDALSSLFNQYGLDAVLYPTTNNVVSRVGEVSLSSNADVISPVLGVPSLSIPMGSSDGLYYGMDLLGLIDSENILYSIASGYEKVNETYIIPSMAEELYTVPDEVTILINVYEEYKNQIVYFGGNTDEEENYNNIVSNIKDFFINYNNYDNKEETSLSLLDSYLISIEKIANYKSELFNLIVIIFIFIVIFCFALFFISNRKRKKFKKIYKRRKELKN